VRQPGSEAVRCCGSLSGRCFVCLFGGEIGEDVAHGRQQLFRSLVQLEGGFFQKPDCSIFPEPLGILLRHAGHHNDGNRLGQRIFL